MASSHTRFSDSLLLPLICRRRVTFLAKAEYFTGRGARGLATRAFFAGLGQIPVDRNGAVAAHESLVRAQQLLGSGGVWGIYPEGTRCPDSAVHRGHTGAVRVATRTGAPVLPVSITWSTRRIGRPVVTFGAPLRFSREDDVRRNTEQLMRAIAELADLPYVDNYVRRAA